MKNLFPQQMLLALRNVSNDGFYTSRYFFIMTHDLQQGDANTNMQKKSYLVWQRENFRVGESIAPSVRKSPALWAWRAVKGNICGRITNELLHAEYRVWESLVFSDFHHNANISAWFHVGLSQALFLVINIHFLTELDKVPQSQEQ